MKALIALVLIVTSPWALAIDRKPIMEVDVTALTKEGQVLWNNSKQIDLIWWVPAEFWQASLYQNPSANRAQVDEVLDLLGNYSVVAVVQADVSPLGAVTYFDRSRVASGLVVEHVAEDGTVSDLGSPVNDPDVNLVLNQLHPVLSAALGNLGSNLYFFAYADRDEQGNRVASPYKKGEIRARVTPREGAPTPEFAIELPLDALMVPRTCPNGKPAHVSWSYCPWSGKRL